MYLFSQHSKFLQLYFWYGLVCVYFLNVKYYKQLQVFDKTIVTFDIGVFKLSHIYRFMPDGIYLNARELGPEKLARKMYELIIDPDKYADFFRWRNHYSYHLRHESIETDDYCRFCSMLNEENLVRTQSIYSNFKEWWDPPHRC